MAGWGCDVESPAEFRAATEVAADGSPAAAPGAPVGVALFGPWQEHATACHARCLNFVGSGCGLDDNRCFSQCMQGYWSSPDTLPDYPCYDEALAMLWCHAEADGINIYCQSSECVPEYKDLNACAGYCVYDAPNPWGTIGNSSSYGGGVSSCDAHTGCFSHEYETECTDSDGVSPSCTCWIDGIQVGSCNADPDLGDVCDSSNLLFHGCCAEYYLPVLMEE